MRKSEDSEPPDPTLSVVILAAGQGTRMRSTLPKVLHSVAGRPMIRVVLSVAHSLQPADCVVVVSRQPGALASALADAPTVKQQEQLGTGHAVLQARERLLGRGERVVVLYGDTPLVRADTIQRLVSLLDSATIAVLTADLADPAGYGRIVRDPDGGVSRIVEEADAGPATRALHEVNSGLMAFQAEWLWDRLPRLQKSPRGEYYLTALVELALSEGLRVSAFRADDPSEVLGINTQAQLAEANRIAWARSATRLLDEGVTILDPATTYIEEDVTVAAGTTIYPNTHLQAGTTIGRNCQIGPNTIILGSVIGDRCRVWMSVVEQSTLETDVQMGPFSHLRPGCHVGARVELGNYSEAKNARIGADTKVHHFSYLGDAVLGARVNIGAGSITCNYDGAAKHETVIEEDAFIGSDTMLVAPVTIGARARTGAGSVVTRDVPHDTTVVGVPARPFRSERSGDTSGERDGA